MIAVILLCLVLLVNHKVQYASAEGSDRSLTVLAGTTAIAKGEAYPVVQRPPLYSVLLALVGCITRRSPEPTVNAAREFGNNNRLSVGKSYLELSFLRIVLWLQILFFVSTGLLTIALLRVVGCYWKWVSVAVVLLLLAPNSWQGVAEVYDAVFTQCLLAIGVFSFALSHKKSGHAMLLFVSAISFTLVALCHATFQMLAPILAILMFVPVMRTKGKSVAIKMALGFFAVWLVMVGGWAVRNYYHAGFLGMSAVGGAALGTRTALFLERAESSFPTETPIFIALRNEELISSPEHTGVFWGSGATRWLMQNRGLSYVEANQFVGRVNLAAIRRAPLRYLRAVSESVISFLWPGTYANTGALRLPFTLIEFLLAGLFMVATVLWGSFHILPRIVIAHAPRWLPMDTIIILSLSVFWYTAAITSMLDVGKPQQRQPVQFIMPVVVALAAARLRKKPNLKTHSVLKGV
jgi:hypothetical protein